MAESSEEVTTGSSPTKKLSLIDRSSVRTVTYRYLRLPYITKMRIAQDMELLRDEDEGITDTELFKRIFLRAHEKGELEQLWSCIETYHGKTDLANNPFKGT